MTLFKQLFMGTSLAFMLIVVATESIYIRNAHQYLQEQLTSHAQDAATSLGMVLPTSIADGDLVRAEVTVNALFDRGYYQTIRVIDIKGDTVILKTLSPTPAGVPQWFVDFFPLQAPSAESLVTKGWRQLGRVVVASHPNFAYKQLWRTLWEATLWLTLLYLLALAALHRFLTRILTPLHAIEAVAHAISERDFKLVNLVPRTRELRSVVNAINSMSKKLRGIIEYEVQQATRFRDESNQDVLTGLRNRRGFEDYMHNLFEGDRNLSSGVMCMIQVAEFQAYNKLNGYQHGDSLLKEVAAALRVLGNSRELLAARINGATFVLLVPNLTRVQAEAIASEINSALAVIIHALSHSSPVSIGSGATYFSGQAVTLAALMSQTDLLTLQSMMHGKNLCVLHDLQEDEQSKGSQYWKKLITDALAADQITLFAQTVMSMRSQEQMQVEVVGRLRHERGEFIPAQQFIPMANRHQLTPAFDLALLKRLIGRMASGMVTDEEVAVNLSVHSLHDETLLAWLSGALQADAAVAKRLVFEFTEFGIVQDRSGVESFVDAMRKLGANFAVDNFGLHQSAFEYLQKLKPRYVKLSPTYIRDLQDNQKHQFFISSVVMITRPLEIRVIALGVEHADILPLLRDLGVDGYQGYVTGAMTELS